MSQPAPGSGRDPEQSAIEAAIAARAGSYVGHAGSAAHARLVAVEHRPASSIYRFVVEIDGTSRRVFVKRPRLRATTANARRPLLVPATPAERKARLEFTALRAIQAELEARGDPRIGAVAALDLLEDPPAVVMEEVRTPDLRALVRQSILHPRVSPSRRRTTTAMHHAGIWLRALHDLLFEDAEPVRSTVDELVAAADAYLAFLEPYIGSARARAVAARVVPALRGIRGPMRLGVNHGDFALRNVLVEDGGRVRCVDLLGRWRTPVLEDVAAFLNALHGGRGLLVIPPRLSARLTADWRAAFLAGYFGDEPVPDSDLRAYRALLLLDRWAAATERHHGGWRSRLGDGAMHRMITSVLA